MLLNKLINSGVNVPNIAKNVHYETLMGSRAYGINSEESDYDVYGFCIPPKDIVFPHLSGLIYGFSKIQEFNQYQTQKDEYDVTIYNIVRYFRLCADGNPNMIDSLFTPENCVTHCTFVGRMVRDARKLFLSKRVWKNYRAYGMSQLHKARSKNPTGKRISLIEKYGFDTKFCGHIIRLYDEAEQILLEGDLDIQRAKDIVKSIRRGEWTLKQVEDWVFEKDKALEAVYPSCKLPDRPDEEKVKELLLNCLEEHYGSLKGVIEERDWFIKALRGIDELLQQYRKKL